MQKKKRKGKKKIIKHGLTKDTFMVTLADYYYNDNTFSLNRSINGKNLLYIYLCVCMAVQKLGFFETLHS